MKIKAVEGEAERLILQLDQEKQEDYKNMKVENENYLAQIQKKQQQYELLNKKYKAIEAEIKHDGQKTKALDILSKLFEAKEKEHELESSLKSSEDESGSQEKTRLLKQVKEDNLETSAMERKVLELEQEIERLKQQIGDNQRLTDLKQSN